MAQLTEKKQKAEIDELKEQVKNEENKNLKLIIAIIVLSGIILILGAVVIIRLILKLKK